MKKLIVYAYGEMGYECLDFLIAAGCDISAVVTHADNPDENIWFRSVEALAQAHQIPVYCFDNPNTKEAVTIIKNYKPDIIFSFYYRKLFGRELLALPILGAYNMHGSMLPTYRGRVPTHWAIINGEKITGVTLHHMSKRIDGGDIVDQESVIIEPSESSHEVFIKQTKAARLILQRQLPAILASTAPRLIQDESIASYYGGRSPDDGRIDWRAPSKQIYNLIRATTEPYPGAFTFINGNKFLVWWAEVDDIQGGEPGEVLRLQPLSIATQNGSLIIKKFTYTGQPIKIGDKCE